MFSIVVLEMKQQLWEILQIETHSYSFTSAPLSQNNTFPKAAPHWRLPPRATNPNESQSLCSRLAAAPGSESTQRQEARERGNHVAKRTPIKLLCALVKPWMRHLTPAGGINIFPPIRASSVSHLRSLPKLIVLPKPQIQRALNNGPKASSAQRP